ncbi:MAG: Panacea domain-containing protein [Patescibacteria group bacterium]
MDAQTIAKYFVIKARENNQEVSKLKTLKLLYYTQACYLTAYEKPLFHDKIEAWRYGPVVPIVYQNWTSILEDELSEGQILDLQKYNNFLDIIWSKWNKLSPIEIMKETHIEDPWIDAYKTESNEITLNSLYEYFKPRLKFTRSE